MYVVDKPCSIYRLRGNPMMIIGFPSNLYILQGFPTTGNPCKDPVMPCKHLQCRDSQWQKSILRVHHGKYPKYPIIHSAHLPNRSKHLGYFEKSSHHKSIAHALPHNKYWGIIQIKLNNEVFWTKYTKICSRLRQNYKILVYLGCFGSILNQNQHNEGMFKIWQFDLQK